VSTPKSIVAKLHDAFGKVVSSADIRERLDKQAVEVALGSSQEFGAL
jgi:tripartite-type tricarboxylate transporter receptor subunit TctC